LAELNAPSDLVNDAAVEVARRLITLALGDGDPTQGPADRQIIDSWAAELGVSSWYDWNEPNE
jgi:hypothetical protein